MALKVFFLFFLIFSSHILRIDVKAISLQGLSMPIYCRSYVFYQNKKEIFHIVYLTLVYIYIFIDQVHPYLTSPSALSNAQNGAEVFFVMHALSSSVAVQQYKVPQ